MCGIAGFISATPRPFPDSVIERMTEILAHRGPDSFGYFRDAYASLGHRRLSIIDLASGAQPMFNEDRSLVIVYNGEIFNHADLRPELEHAGHRYHSRSDTETILHSYEEHGPAGLAAFRGMFAFAIWDSRRRRLFAARDRLGIKPFYYFYDGRLFAFASEIKALFEHPAISPCFDDATLPEYLALGYTCGARTMFRHIHQLSAGCWLQLCVADDGLQLHIEPYWDAPHGPPAPPRPDQEYIAECRHRLEETVRLRLMSDVPLGVFLSGGVDSSAIAALVRRMSTGPVKTFAVGYRETAFSELEYASRVARRLGTEHRSVVVDSAEFFETLPRLIWHEDEPITWPSSVSLYFVARLAAQDVKVVLTGEGSDELFAGYNRYRLYLDLCRWARRYQIVPSRLRAALRRWIQATRLLSPSLRRRLEHTPIGREDGFVPLYVENFYAAFAIAEQELLGRPPSYPYEGMLNCFEKASAATLLARLLYADQKTYLVELLRKQDRMSMACSIESRVPFLDHHFVAFAHSIPDHLKIRNRQAKYILKRAVEDLLPRDIIHRPKMGFPTPLAQWLRQAPGQGMLELLRDPKGLLAAYLDRKALEALLEDHAARRRDVTDKIWRLLNLQLWGDLFLTGRRALRLEASTLCGLQPPPAP